MPESIIFIDKEVKRVLAKTNHEHWLKIGNELTPIDNKFFKSLLAAIKRQDSK